MYWPGIAIETYNEDLDQYLITDARNISWSTHYGEKGGGYGYLKFALPRKVGHLYQDIRLGFEIIVRKYLNTILFHGQIRKLDEKTSSHEDLIEVTALGWAVVAGDDEIMKAFCETHYSEWVVTSEIPAGSYRPDLFTTWSNDVGMGVHANNNQALEASDYTELVYTFLFGETAERIVLDLSVVLGSGTIFDATISSLDKVSGYVDYTDDSGESQVDSNMILYNSTMGETATVSSIDTGTNRITVTAPGEISTWSTSDEISVYGPLFSATVSSIASAVITYTVPIVGESNISANQILVNLTKKLTATVQTNNPGANTITVTDGDHLSGWEPNDVIAIPAPIFSALFSSDSGTTITYSSPIGERVASSATGWVLHNATEDEYATVDSWNISSNQLDVTDAGDITGNWTSSDVLNIYSPFRVKILDSSDTLIWPTSDWREGATPRSRDAIDELSAGSPTAFKLRLEQYLSGTANEYSFATFNDIKAYSIEVDADIDALSEYVVTLLSASGHDLGGETRFIDVTQPKELDRMVFEGESPAEALAQVCSYGDVSGDPIAWGIQLNDDKILYVEDQDEETIDYLVRRHHGGEEISYYVDVQDSVQQARGVYTDVLGRKQVTAWQTETDEYFTGHYRRKSISLSNIDTDAEAVAVVQLYLVDNAPAKSGTSVSVSGHAMSTYSGAPVPFDEIQATGRLMALVDLRRLEIDDVEHSWDFWTQEQLVGVEVDYDSGVAQLIPSSARSEFERYMKELSRMAE